MVIDAHLPHQFLLRSMGLEKYPRSFFSLIYELKSFVLNASKLVLELFHIFIVFFCLFSYISVCSVKGFPIAHLLSFARSGRRSPFYNF